MTYSVSFLPEADMDLDDASEWYERRGEGLGDDFRRAVEQVVDTIELYPNIHPVLYGRVRRARMGRFPYSVIYAARGDRVIILGIFHNRRDPRLWRRRWWER